MRYKGNGNKKSIRDIRRVRTMLILIPLFVLVVAAGVFVYAKYYSHNNASGIAVASSIYFTANYAVESDAEDEFFECIVASGYQGEDYSFEFEVRNYENVMLFNDSSVVIPYSVYFWLGGETDTVYTVECNGETITLSDKTRQGFSDQSIAGGKALANEYTITVDVNNDENTSEESKSVPIYVEVVTDQGAVVNRALRGKMVLSSSVRAETYVESAEFIISKTVATDEKKFEEIQKLSELTYEIRTVGNVVADASVTDELKLSWDPTVFEIDLYNSAYLTWTEKTGNTAPLTDSKGWNYIIIEVMPYSANVIYFFRGEDFEEKITDMNTLNYDFISVEKYQDSNQSDGEGTE